MCFLISTAELECCLEKGTDMVLVDLRDPESFAREHIAGAINIPNEDLPTRWKELPIGRTIVFYCHRGPNGLLAARNLSRAGYRAANVCGGIQAYRGKYRV